MPPRLIMQAVKVLIEAAEARRKGQKVKGMDSGEVAGRRGEPKPVY